MVSRKRPTTDADWGFGDGPKPEPEPPQKNLPARLPEPSTTEVAIPVHLQEKAREYLEAELAKNTRAAYKSALRGFFSWCEDEQRSPVPATAGTVVGYITWLAQKGRPWSTINQHLSAVAKIHEEHGHDSPREEAAVRKACKGIRRTHGTAPKNKKAALLRADVEKVLAALPAGTIMSVRDEALLLLGFACALRREELSELDVADVAFTPRGMTVTIKSSKTDKSGKGEVMGVPLEAARTIVAMQGWLGGRGLEAGPLFLDFTPKGKLRNPPVRLSPQGVGKVVLRSLERAGVIPRQPRRKPSGAARRVRTHGAHSLRSGFITQARIDGKALDEIMTQSRHKSYEVARGYIRHVDVFDQNAARGVAL